MPGVARREQVPVVMLTAKGDEIDRIVGLEVGADDYLPKPFNPRELLARIKAVLRRSRSVEASVPRFRSADRIRGLDSGYPEARAGGSRRRRRGPVDRRIRPAGDLPRSAAAGLVPDYLLDGTRTARSTSSTGPSMCRSAACAGRSRREANYQDGARRRLSVRRGRRRK